MSDFDELLSELGLSERLSGIAKGDIVIPVIGSLQPPDLAGFPPALIPLWVDGPIGFGLWHHWSWRGSSFGRVSMELQRCTEIARTEAQLVRWVCQAAICYSDGITPKIERFAAETGVDDLQAVDEMTLTSGDDPAGLLTLRDFLSEAPAGSFKASTAYTGEFPIDEAGLGFDRANSYCGYELSDELLASLGNRPDAPAWLSGENPQSTFEDLIQAGDEKSAWLCLNSRGWTLTAAATALAELADRHRGSTFAAWAKVWIDSNRGVRGAY